MAPVGIGPTSRSATSLLGRATWSSFYTQNCLAIAGFGGPPGPGVGDLILWPCNGAADKDRIPLPP